MNKGVIGEMRGKGDCGMSKASFRSSNSAAAARVELDSVEELKERR